MALLSLSGAASVGGTPAHDIQRLGARPLVPADEREGAGRRRSGGTPPPSTSRLYRRALLDSVGAMSTIVSLTGIVPFDAGE